MKRYEMEIIDILDKMEVFLPESTPSQSPRWARTAKNASGTPTQPDKLTTTATIEFKKQAAVESGSVLRFFCYLGILVFFTVLLLASKLSLMVDVMLLISLGLCLAPALLGLPKLNKQ